MRVTVFEGGRQIDCYTLSESLIRIGRDPTSDITLKPQLVSARHGVIERRDVGIVYEDLLSTNGSYIRRRGTLIRVDETCHHQIFLEHADELLFGEGETEFFLQFDFTDMNQPMSVAENVEVEASLDATEREIITRLSSGFDREALLALHRYTTACAETPESAENYRQFIETVLSLFRKADHAAIYLSHESAVGDYEIAMSRDRDGNSPCRPLSRTLHERVLDQGQAITFMATDADFDFSESLQSSGIHAGMCAPLWNGQEIMGLVQIDKRSEVPGTFERRELEVLVVFANQLALTLQNERLHAGLKNTIDDLKETQGKIERLAFYDSLTGLSNRRLFRDRLEQAVKLTQRGSYSAALLYLDLDHFKLINDTFGHDAGDSLLRAVADRLCSCVREQDTVARIGGDEFAVLLVNPRGSRGTRTVANKILEVLRKPIALSDQQLTVTTSIGITIAPDDGLDPLVLQRNADLAMYRAKKYGRDNFQFYTDGMNSEASHRLFLENELREGLVRGEFIQHFQPVMRLDSARLSGVEALVRWQHPERGLLSPGQFIQVAEETGLIVQLGEWVLRNACTQASALFTPGRQPMKLSVNLSARQFIEPGMPDLIEDILKETKFDPRNLEIELTESMLMVNTVESISKLQSLKALGLSLSLDDFGTGYSSLSYLKSFPIDTLKVDRSFVRDIPSDPNDMEITAAMIAMAHKLNIKVVGEGIETAEQLNFLRDNQCDFGQGFLFSHPLPLPELAQRYSGHLGN